MATTVPKLLTTPFAANGAKNEIPLQAVTVPGKTNMASWMLGFPPVTMMALEAGGMPPEGMDMNGVLNAISSHIVFQNKGGQYKFDAEFAEALGGYPAGVILVSDDFKSAYISLVDNNTENFNTASPITQWKAFAGEAAGNVQATESAAGIARIATASEVTAGTNDGTIITPAKLANALSTIQSATQATESAAGIARIATSSQVSSGADDTTIVTPKKMAAALSSFKGSAYKSTNGYAHLTNGVILVWGQTSNEVSTTVNVSWSTAFPNACIFAVGSQTVYTGSTALDAYVQANSLSRTGCTFGVYSYGQGFRASYLYWFAVGY